jgi:hypothetical protein
MPIPEKVRAAVKEKVLQDLEEYFGQAEEMEDEVTLQDPYMWNRLRDFYRFQWEVHKKR